MRFQRREVIVDTEDRLARFDELPFFVRPPTRENGMPAPDLHPLNRRGDIPLEGFFV